jgi:hypothetical protein
MIAQAPSIRRILASVAMQDFQLPRELPPQFTEPLHRAAEDAFVGIVPLLCRAFFLFVSGTMLLGSSMGAYGLFYLAVMPSHHATEPLYFDYSGLVNHPAPIICIDDNDDDINSLDVDDKNGRQQQQQQQQVALNNNPERVKQAPWAAADLFSKHVQWESFHNEVVPDAVTNEKHILKPGKTYYLEVALDLPESEINRRVGMFGVLVELQSSDGTKLASSMRAARLPHESKWISIIRKLVFLMPLLIGAVQETRTIIVPSFHHIVESSEQPLVSC